MKKRKLLLVFAYIIVFFTSFDYLESQENDGFILMTTLWNAQTDSRRAELIECFRKNIESSLIEHIVVFYDGHADDAFFQMLYRENERHNKTCFIFIQGRPLFSDYYKMANEKFIGKKIIICNGDIYFDESLKLVNKEVLDNTLIMLSRWECDKSYPYIFATNRNSTEYSIFTTSSFIRKRCYSHAFDSWIFLSPIKSFFSDIYLGTWGCEKVGYYAYLSGMNVINPAVTIKSYHLHAENRGTYNNSISYPPPYLSLKIDTLSHSMLFEAPYLLDQ